MKVSFIGAGQVGATAAYMLASKDVVSEIVMVDIDDAVIGKALDMMCCSPLVPFESVITGSTDYSSIADSSLIVITAGLARKQGMTREDLLAKNSAIMSSIASSVKEHAPDAICIIVTNPLDVMTYLFLKKSGLAKQRVIGMAGVLDSARLRNFIAAELKVSPAKVEGMVMGAHGDSMVPLPELTLVDGKPITSLLDADAIARLVERTAKCGGEVVKYLKTGSAYYSPAASIIEMVTAILSDSSKMLPCSVFVSGEYGLFEMCMGLPVKLGKNGVAEIVELDLSAESSALLKASAEVTRANIVELGL
ncbi:MAG: malate dehydrogenase [Nanoarchaeota archaeon]|nr:malate dehydrogenase [Nanoarchaeota archaeon]